MQKKGIVLMLNNELFHMNLRLIKKKLIIFIIFLYFCIVFTESIYRLTGVERGPGLCTSLFILNINFYSKKIGIINKKSF